MKRSATEAARVTSQNCQSWIGMVGAASPQVSAATSAWTATPAPQARAVIQAN